MTSDVVLTSALRNNLLSLQNTQSLIDITQFRLSTGRKVNSALDNPQSFFAAESLNNRAGDLERLLDGLGQNIQAIKAADNGITALTQLVQQADSLTSTAQTALAQGTAEAKVTGDADLSGVDDLTSLSNINNTDTITFTVIDPDTDTAITLNNAGVVTFDTNDSVQDIIQEINDLNQGVNGEDVISAELNTSGQLVIKSLNGGIVRMQFEAVGGGGTDAADQAFAGALGFANVVGLESDGLTNVTGVTVSSSATVDSVAQGITANGSFSIADASTSLASLDNFANVDNAGDELTITINGETTTTNAIELFQDADGNNQTIQGFIDDINSDTGINSLVEASYDDTTGVISFRALDASVESIEFSYASNTGDLDVGFDFGTGRPAVITSGTSESELVRFGAAAGELANLETEFENVRTQIDELITDTGYRGTNLLNGDNLVSYFDEFRASSLTTTGVTYDSAGLGIDEANFSNAASINSSVEEIRVALESIRSFGNALANDLSIVQARETFTKATINTLTEGSDNLTLADQNEEGAALLALQTRQQLGVTSLALASQSQQSILRLF
jgi:hypothetical protein